MKIAFLGDLAFIGKYDLETNKFAEKTLEPIAKILRNYDLVVGNLETPFTSKTTSKVPKSMHLRSPVINVRLLKYLNIGMVSLANNHIYDYGKYGLEETIRTLELNDIQYFGVNGKSLKVGKLVFRGYCCYSANASKYRVWPFNKGVNALSFKQIKTALQHDKAEGFKTMLAIHWGDEHTNFPRKDHVKLVSRLTKYNSFVISGHHPHVIQPIQVIGDSIVSYSQGNFCFDDCYSITPNELIVRQNDENKEGYILELDVVDGLNRSYGVRGVKEINKVLFPSRITEKLDSLAEKFEYSYKKKDYKSMRMSQFKNKELLENKFGKRDFLWLRKRMNYYSILAYLMGKINIVRYWFYLARHLD